MMKIPRYDFVYEAVFSFLAEHGIFSYPIDHNQICSILGIRTATMVSVTQKTSLSTDDLYAFCGNSDGAVFTLLPDSPTRHTIIYNSAKPVQRQRFTIAEECAHVLLGHSDDPHFLVSRIGGTNQDDLYRAYEQEARAAAGLLLCSPKIMNLCAQVLDPKIISLACDISETCAAVRIEQHKYYGQAMRAHPAYAALPAPRITSTQARAAIFKKLKTQCRVKKFAHL